MRVIITGAASGIGQATTRLLLGQGTNEALLVDTDDAALRAVAEPFGQAAHTMVADVGAPASGERIVAAAVEALGGIEGIVSNAGMIRQESLRTLSIEDFDRTIAVNTRATWLIARAAYPILCAGGGGSIVATGSMAASHPAPPLGAYAMSKAALVMMMRQLSYEWGPDGIRCNTVSPGSTATGMNRHLLTDEETKKAYAANIPTRRMGEPEDVAHAILYLLSDAARQVTGIDLLVDGGASNTLMPAARPVAPPTP